MYFIGQSTSCQIDVKEGSKVFLFFIFPSAIYCDLLLPAQMLSFSMLLSHNLYVTSNFVCVC